MIELRTEHDTLDKVNRALRGLGWTEPQIIDAINEILNFGVFFAERVEDDDDSDDDDEMTPEEQAAWDALTPEEQVALAFAPIEVPPLPKISVPPGIMKHQDEIDFFESMTPEEEAAWDALSQEERDAQFAEAMSFEVPPLPMIYVPRGGLGYPEPLTQGEWEQKVNEALKPGGILHNPNRPDLVFGVED